MIKQVGISQQAITNAVASKTRLNAAEAKAQLTFKERKYFEKLKHEQKAREGINWSDKENQ